MSYKREGHKPPRPPPPKASLGSKLTSGSIGISFKALEEEEDEDLTIFTGKFDKVVEEAHKSQRSSHERRGSSGEPKLIRTGSTSIQDSKLTKLHSHSKSLDDGNSSPTKKSFFEYKDIISDIKHKITDTKEKITDSISKRIEEFSGDSSSNPSPENEQPLDDDILVTERENILTDVRPERVPVVQDALPSSVKDDLVDHFQECEEDSSGWRKDDEEDDDIDVVDEYFGMNSMEDFSSNPGLNVSVRQRSKLNRFVNKNSKPVTSATVTMSTLMVTSPAEEELQFNLEVRDENNEPVVEKTESGPKADQETASNHDKETPTTLEVVKSTEKTVPIQKLVAVAVCVFAYLIMPLPSYVSGLMMGAMLASAGWALYLWYKQPPKQHEEFKLTPLEDLPPMYVPHMKDPVKDDGIYKGWMNELLEYNPDDYHINQTHSVYISLEGAHLRLQRPKIGVPKRAMWDEAFTPSSFIHQRHFDLQGSRVFLLPPGLVKKRIWSKKYPICVALAQSGTKTASTPPAVSGSPKHTTTPISDGELGFEIIDEEKCDSGILYLFARTGREKEDWYKRFVCASMGKPLGNHLLDLKKAILSQSKHKRSNSDTSLRHKRQGSTDSVSSTSSQAETPVPPSTKENQSVLDVDLLAFAQYMGRLMPSTSSVSSPGKENNTWSTISGSLICDKQLFWVNAMVGRIFWDFLRDKWWSEKVTEKLQRKLSKIHVPYFIEELQVMDIDMGSEIPAIRRAGKPYLDEKGFWVDLDIAYNGGFKMTIATKVNLMKLKKTTHQNVSQRPLDKRSPITDSDEEDSAESSTDEEEETPTSDESAASGGTTSKKFLRYLDKITQSKYFQQATEYKYIKRAMEGVSNTPLILTVEVKTLVGTMALNIPPPPTDRFWYGFRGNPRLWLSAKPKVGEREVTFNYITEWIEKKLSVEFQRVFVMPNMDDLVIPILLPGILPEAIPVATPSATTLV
ncbi:testis-expressed protein 2-like [Haliotis asinina]|uniref:testis-expressed protein 2-like n=1 Tax=Haliotis asinina TaxID=109174 RepID=UPI0035322EEB